MSNESRKAELGDVAVVGGGLGGLAAAAYLVRSGRSVTVFDTRKRLGGRSTTDERRGFLFNQGPHALYVGGPAESVLTELGIKPVGGSPNTKGGTILRKGKLHLGPASVMTLLRTSGLSLGEKRETARFLARLPKMNPEDHRHLPVQDWLDSTLTTDGGRRLAEALVRLTTYTNHPSVLSADVAIGQTQMGLTTGVLYLDGGWQQLVDRFAATLEANPLVDFRLGTRISELPDARAVVVATGDPDSTGNLIGKRFTSSENGSGHPGLGPAARAACLDLGVSFRPDTDLIIGVDEPLYLSNHSSGGRLAPDGRWHVAAVRYLGDGERGARPELETFATRGWKNHELSEITVESRYLHDMVAVSAVPVATGGGLAGRPRSTDSGHRNVFVVGDWVGPSGHLVDASLASAKSAAMEADKLLDSAVVA